LPHYVLGFVISFVFIQGFLFVLLCPGFSPILFFPRLSLCLIVFRVNTPLCFYPGLSPCLNESKVYTLSYYVQGLQPSLFFLGLSPYLIVSRVGTLFFFENVALIQDFSQGLSSFLSCEMINLSLGLVVNLTKGSLMLKSVFINEFLT
jgi:hypothetical protein